MRVVATMASKLWRAGKRGQRSRHTLDAPPLEYVPAVQEAHVADELAPVALEYVPATQEAHVDAPDHTDKSRVWCVRLSMRHTRHAGRHEERQQ